MVLIWQRADEKRPIRGRQPAPGKCPQMNTARAGESAIVGRNPGRALRAAGFANPNPWGGVAALVSSAGQTPRRRIQMLWTMAVILSIAWLLGIAGGYGSGSLVHVLLVAAIVLFVASQFTRRLGLR